MGPQCPHCKGQQFSAKEWPILGIQHNHVMVWCATCRAPIAVLSAWDPGRNAKHASDTADAILQRLKTLEGVVGDIQHVVSQIQR